MMIFNIVDNLVFCQEGSRGCQYLKPFTKASESVFEKFLTTVLQLTKVLGLRRIDLGKITKIPLIKQKGAIWGPTEKVIIRNFVNTNTYSKKDQRQFISSFWKRNFKFFMWHFFSGFSKFCLKFPPNKPLPHSGARWRIREPANHRYKSLIMLKHPHPLFPWNALVKVNVEAVTVLQDSLVTYPFAI